MMTKNYFTDEQVKALIQKVDDCATYEDIHDIEGFYLDELKTIMNLAVETAIKPVGYKFMWHIDGQKIENIKLGNCETLRAAYDLTYTNFEQVFTVKELEN